MKFSAGLLPLLAAASADGVRGDKNSLRGPADPDAAHAAAAVATNNAEQHGRELWSDWGGHHHPPHNKPKPKPGTGPSCVWSKADTCPHGGRGHCDKDRRLCESWECRGRWHSEGCKGKHKKPKPPPPHHHKPPPVWDAPHPAAWDAWDAAWDEPTAGPRYPPRIIPTGETRDAFVNDMTFAFDEPGKTVLRVGPFTITGECIDGRPQNGTTRFELNLIATAAERDILVFGRGDEFSRDFDSITVNSRESYGLLRVNNVGNEPRSGAYSSSDGYYVSIDGSSCIAIQRDDPERLAGFGDNVNCVLSCKFCYAEPPERKSQPW